MVRRRPGPQTVIVFNCDDTDGHVVDGKTVRKPPALDLLAAVH